MSCLTTTHSVDLQTLHTFGLPAFARKLRLLQTLNDLQAYARAHRAQEPSILLGEGSNTVFVNHCVDATVWKLSIKGRQYLGCDGSHHHLRVQAGENWHQLVEWSVAKGWAGLENLALIPGCVGASPVQNIGAYGVELKDRVSALHVFDLKSEKFCHFTVPECEFAYRDSIFKQAAQNRYVITAVDFSLPVQWQPQLAYGDLAHRATDFGAITPTNVMKAVCAIRTEKLPDPMVWGNSGSFFKNPVVPTLQAQSLAHQFPGLVAHPTGNGLVKLAAAWLIDQCGLRGFSHKGVAVYDKQALILVNLGQGQGQDLMALIQHIQVQVQSKFGVLLELEPNLI